MNDKPRSEKTVKLGSLWAKEDKQGRFYLTGQLGDCWINIFQNGYKEQDNQPDYYIYLNQKEFKKEGEQNG